MAENFKDLWEKFSGFFEQKKISIIKTMLEECYDKRCVDRNIGGHRWRTWVEAFYKNMIMLLMVKAEEPYTPIL